MLKIKNVNYIRFISHRNLNT